MEQAQLRAALERLVLPRDGLCRLCSAAWFEKAVADKYVRVPLSGAPANPTSGVALSGKLLRVVGVEAGPDRYEIRYVLPAAPKHSTNGDSAPEGVVSQQPQLASSSTRLRLKCIDYASRRVTTVQLSSISNSKPASAEVDALISDAFHSLASGAKLPPLPSGPDAVTALSNLNRMLRDADQGRACVAPDASSTSFSSSSSSGCLWGAQQSPPLSQGQQTTQSSAALLPPELASSIDGFLFDSRHRVAVILRSWLAQDAAVGTVVTAAAGDHAGDAPLALSANGTIASSVDAGTSSAGTGKTDISVTVNSAPSSSSVPREWLPCLSGPPSSATSGIVLTVADEANDNGANNIDASASSSPDNASSLLKSSARPEAFHRGITPQGFGSGPGRRLERASGSYHYLFLHRVVDANSTSSSSFTSSTSPESAAALVPPCILADPRYDEYQPDLTALRLIKQFWDDGITLPQLRTAILAQLDLPRPSLSSNENGVASDASSSQPITSTPSHHPVRSLSGSLQLYVIDADALGAARGAAMLAARGVIDHGKALSEAIEASSPTAADGSGPSGVAPVTSAAVHLGLHHIKSNIPATLYVRRLTQRNSRIGGMLDVTAKQAAAKAASSSTAGDSIATRLQAGQYYYDGALGHPSTSAAEGSPPHSVVSTLISPSGCVWLSEQQIFSMIAGQDDVGSAGVHAYSSSLASYTLPALYPWLPRLLQLGPCSREILGRVIGSRVQSLSPCPGAATLSAQLAAGSGSTLPSWPLSASIATTEDPRVACEALLKAYAAGGMHVLHNSSASSSSAAGTSSSNVSSSGAGRKRGRDEMEAGDNSSTSSGTGTSGHPVFVCPPLRPVASSNGTGAPFFAADGDSMSPLPWCPALFPRRGGGDAGGSSGVKLTLYHGTSTALANLITAEGGVLRRPLCRRIAHKCAFGLCDCQMEGFGLYLADREKAKLYALRRANVDPSGTGALLTLEVDVGVLAVATSDTCPCGCARAFLDHHGAWYAAKGCDTLYVRDDSWPATKTAEWAVADPARVRVVAIETVTSVDPAPAANGSGGDASNGTTVGAGTMSNL